EKICYLYYGSSGNLKIHQNFLNSGKISNILKITHPFREIGIPHINPAIPFEEAMEMMERM
ncbi:MAG: hypothetical protein KJ729_09095, partial [Euryarchaeota archaeon]|nr:hypothetical protein [Euryarchaeota archaeon]